ncbi:MAG: deazaflavin-dependent oxidoreductase (nitroreductase family) [Candidatus Azotimanducaceae bacterium]|jgi:deazaflavin-dependent oxidoreductase (nitroreductase family)
MANPADVSWIAEHIALYKTDPEKAHMWDSSPLGGPGILPTLLLTTTGRKSGEARALPLIYGELSGSHVIIASKGGAPTHPRWFENLEAHPDCHIQVGAKSISARARVIPDGEEREKIWDQMVKIYSPYTDYKEATDRQIPVVVLDPI